MSPCSLADTGEIIPIISCSMIATAIIWSLPSLSEVAGAGSDV